MTTQIIKTDFRLDEPKLNRAQREYVAQQEAGNGFTSHSDGGIGNRWYIYERSSNTVFGFAIPLYSIYALGSFTPRSAINWIEEARTHQWGDDE